ncbi:transcription termination factor Rho [Bifidobacterium callitrichos]|nr:transcription termination factor Rho [Bifidobacterium callitrichos]
MANSQNLEDMKLPELKELAKQMGLRGTSTMRKPELLATLQAARSGGEAPAGVTVRAPKTAKSTKAKAAKQNDLAAAVAEAAAAPSSEPAQAVPAQPVSSEIPQAAADSTAAPVQEPVQERVDSVLESFTPITPAEPVAAPADSIESAASHERREDDADRGRERAARTRARRSDAARSGDRGQVDAASLLDSLDLGEGDSSADRADRTERKERGRRHIIDENGDEIIVANVRRRRRPAEESEQNDEVVRDLDDILATLPTQNNVTPRVEDEEEPRRARGGDRNGHNGRNAERDDHADRRGRRMRGRDRGRDFEERDDRRDWSEERGDRAERGIRAERGAERGTDRNDRNERRGNAGNEEQNDLVPVAGIVDVLDSYAFVRTSGYLPGPNDVYVSMGQVKKYGLRKGDAVHGAIRAPREGDRRNQRQKFVPLQSIDSINGMSVEEAANRPQFSKLTPLYPQERLKQETTPNKLTGRIMDIVSPIGKGQRGLIVSPPKAGKTITLQNIANSITTNNPEVHLMVVLVDERPEEVTDMERTVQGEVISSTFDRPASDHTTVAELAIERAKRLVELGQDVVVLLDSMTRLARAYNIAAPASGRILSGGVDAQALYPPKKFFGAARNIENGGSLTIISSALVETGSKMDEVIFEEFKGTGNMELRLSRELADKRLFPAIDVNASGTRREELITNPQELPIIYRLRRLLGGMEPEQAYQTLVPRLKKTATNRDFLTALVQQANGSAVNGN